ncbi:MAG: hypothetical protein E7L00_08485 [Propionibacteriaceae bacterium]|nr:hypothetical protein [Propionibacteriaceae bacterium]
MAASKTFARGEILTAQDVNDYLNPSTAEHIPSAMAAGRASVTIPKGFTQGKSANVTITFPPGRFSQIPALTVTVWMGTSYAFVGVIDSITKDRAVVSVVAPISWSIEAATTVSMFWIAVEM